MLFLSMQSQPPNFRVALPAVDVLRRMNVICHETRNLTSRVANLEAKPAGDPLNHRLEGLKVRLNASEKRCEKLQKKTQSAASQ